MGPPGYPFNRSNPSQAFSTGGPLVGGSVSSDAPPRRAARAGRPGPSATDEVLFARRVVSDGQLEHPMERHTAAAGAAPVEAEHTSGQMDSPDGPLSFLSVEPGGGGRILRRDRG